MSKMKPFFGLNILCPKKRHPAGAYGSHDGTPPLLDIVGFTMDPWLLYLAVFKNMALKKPWICIPISKDWKYAVGHVVKIIKTIKLLYWSLSHIWRFPKVQIPQIIQIRQKLSHFN